MSGCVAEFLRLALVVSIVCLTRVEGAQVDAIQSGPRQIGSTFPSDLFFDETNNILHLIVNNQVHLNSSAFKCSYQTLDATSLDETAVFNFGTGDEVCSTIAVDREDSPDRVYIAGYSVKNSGNMLSRFVNAKGPFAMANSEYYGMILDLAIEERIDMYGAGIVFGSKFVFPITVMSDNSTVYTVSLRTNTIEADDYVDTGNNQSETNADDYFVFENPSQVFPRGANFDVEVAAFPKLNYTPDLAEDNTTLLTEIFTSRKWKRAIEAEGDKSITSVAGMLLLEDVILVAGSTNGYGSGLGIANSLVGDSDGFVTKLIKSNGDFYNEPEAFAGQASSFRVQTTEGKDEYIKGICRGESKDVIYVTGSSAGRLQEEKESDGATRGFIIKLNVTDMKQIWSLDFGAHHSNRNESDFPPVVGIACGTRSGKGFVYVAGNVYGHGVLKDAQDMEGTDVVESGGGTDIFLIKVNADTGKKEFVRQIGSSGHEEIAPQGGLFVTQDDYAILYGQTTGYLYRSREVYESESDDLVDFFVSVVGPDGQVSALAKPKTHAPTASPTVAPTTQAPTSTPSQEPPGTSDVLPHNFTLNSIKLRLEGVGYINTEAGEAFEEVTAKWYRVYYRHELERRLEAGNNTAKLTSFHTKIDYWGGWTYGGGNTLTYNQRVSFTTDHADVDYEFAAALLEDPMLDEQNKQDYLTKLSESHETFAPVTEMTGEPRVPPQNRPKNAGGSLDYMLFVYVGAAIFAACICYGMFTARNLSGSSQKEHDYDPKNDADRPEAPLEPSEIA